MGFKRCLGSPALMNHEKRVLAQISSPLLSHTVTESRPFPQPDRRAASSLGGHSPRHAVGISHFARVSETWFPLKQAELCSVPDEQLCWQLHVAHRECCQCCTSSRCFTSYLSGRERVCDDGHSENIFLNKTLQLW